MADTASVTVAVKSTLDAAGLNQLYDKLAEQGKTVKEINEELAKYGAQLDVVKGKIIQTKEASEAAAAATKDGAAAMDLFKTNTSKAIGETQVLVRELITGSFHARTLGSLLSALGPAAVAGGLAVLVIVEALKNAVEQAIKLREEAAKDNEELVKMAHNWERMSQSVKSTADLASLTQSFTSEITKLDDKIASLTRKSADIGGLHRGLQALFATPPANPPGLPNIEPVDLLGLRGSFKPEVDKQLEEAQRQEAEQTKIIAKNIEMGKSMEDLALTFPHTTKFLDDLIDSMGVFITAQQKADTETKQGQKAYAEATQNLLGLQKVIDAVAASNKELDDQTKKLNAEVDQQVKVGNEHLEQLFKQEQAQRDLAQALIPTREQQSSILDQIKELKTQQDGLNRNIQSENQAWLELESRIRNLDTAYKDISGTINAVTENIAKLNAEVNKQVEKGNTGLQAALDLNKKIEAEAAVRNAQGNEELQINEKVNQEKLKIRLEYEAINKAAGTTVVTEDEINKHVEIGGESLRQRLEVIAGTSSAQSTLNVQMKEYETILQNIRQQQQVTGAQAFIGPDEKNLRLLQQYRAELANVINAMQQQARIKGGLTDPAEIAKANKELQKFSAQYQLLAAKIITTTHQFQTGLQNWANSFGSTGQQLANTLQQTVGAALQSFNQWIVTGKFNMQQLLQSIAQLGLQLVEQLIIQRVVAMINARLAETQAVASSKIIAAAWASAATAVTIATEGQAAYDAPLAVGIGLAGVQAALGLGSLHEGGRVSDRRMHSGGLAHDEVPIIAQEGEIMINRSVAQAPGMSDFLLGLNAGMFHSGGFVAGQRYHFGGGGEFFPEFRQGPTPFNFPSGGGNPNFSPPDLPALSDFAGGARETEWYTRMFGGFGTTPSTGLPAFGPTMTPTSWFNYPGVGLVPMAVPNTPDVPFTRSHHFRTPSEAHSGGMIGRMHSGGSVSGGRGGGVHIYAFTDLKALTKHLGSREGQKIIFDTVKGRRIDLGIP